jgi:hypothetical protein
MFQMESDSPLGAFLQLRSSLAFKERYWGIYSRDELLAHELAHIGRMAFTEPRFEEFLAYSSSPNRWRRLLGPLVQSATESALFVLALMLIVAFDLYLIFSGQGDSYIQYMWLKSVPLAMGTAAGIRLWIRHRTYRHCLASLKALGVSPQHLEPVAYRFADSEIELFARSSPKQIAAYIAQQDSPRWRLLRAVYLPAELLDH